MSQAQPSGTFDLAMKRPPNKKLVRVTRTNEQIQSVVFNRAVGPNHAYAMVKKMPCIALATMMLGK